MAGELVERLNWWAAKRKPPKGMATLPADCREAADRIEALERENATLRAERDEARMALDWLARVSRRFDHITDDDETVLVGIRVGDLRRAAAIRNMGGEG